MESIKINENVYDRQSFLNTKKLEFKELFIKRTESTSIPTLEEFFALYNQLFYLIPKEGELSHKTIVNQSSEYLGLSNIDNIDISTLLDEITSLREQLFNTESLLAEVQKANQSQ